FNTDFRLEDLPKTINMSYSGIYRKCHDLTGKTPVELLRKLKLSKAAVLILKNNYNVSEAAFMVGYKDSKYFTKSFKDEFGKTPSTLKKEVNKLGIETVLEKYQFEKLK
ncbi:MAG: helix-turn-helix domain-containing protein, partial [Flavobacteriaceae bacterium]